MIRIVLSLFLAVDLAGCASISHPLPKCDGYSRRPLNRSMWQREDNKPAKQSGNDAVPATATGQVSSYGEVPLIEKPAAFAHFDVVGSYRPCQEG
jgi:type IV secretion system protein VirB7